MAHYAELDKDNKVIRVIVVDNINCANPLIKKDLTPVMIKSISGCSVSLNKAGVKEEVTWESESEGVSYCERILGGRWVKTSYNGNIRKNYAGIGYTYDKKRDAFIPPQPFKSWVLDEKTCRWIAPIPYPEGKEMYNWNEDKQNWEIVK